jgi:uncharacterized membrane protein (UPF0127 family)
MPLPIRLARTRRQRLIGLALRRDPPPYALHFDRCRCVHTFGMRFTLDLVWFDALGGVIRIDRDVPPRRVRRCRGARSVVEIASSYCNRPDAVGAMRLPGPRTATT